MAFQLRNLGPWLRVPEKNNPYKRNWMSLERTINQDTPLCYGATGTISPLTNATTNYVSWSPSSVALNDPFKMLGFGALQHQPTWIRIPWDGVYDFYLDWQITDALLANCELGFPLEQAATNDSGFTSVSFSQFAYDSKTFIETTVDNHHHAFYRGVQFNKDDLVRAGIKTNYGSATLSGITVTQSDFRWTRPIPNRELITPGGPLLMIDASPNGNNGLYIDPGGTSIEFAQPGLITGDTSIFIPSPFLGLGQAIVNAPTGSFWVMGWGVIPTAVPYGGGQPLISFDSDSLGAQPHLEISWAWAGSANPSFSVDRQTTVTYNPAQTIASAFGSATPSVGHMWAIVYNIGAATCAFYVDASLIGTSTGVDTAAFVSTPNVMSIGGRAGSSAGGYDEIAFGNGTITAGQISTIYAARGVFATYKAAVLALNPTAYYHLNESY